MEDIEKAAKQLKKNNATLKRESTKFEPMRKPDIIKLRRESLSKIMLMRKTEEKMREELKETTKTKSPLLAALSPRKRKPDYRMESPKKMKKIVESPGPSSSRTSTPIATRTASTASTPIAARTASSASTPIAARMASKASTASPAAIRRTPPRKAKENTPSRVSAEASTPRAEKRTAPKAPEVGAPANKMDATDGPSERASMRKKVEFSPDVDAVELRKKTRTEFRKQPRNSLRSLSLNRTTRLKQEARPKTIFRSPSIYDEPRPADLQEVQSRKYLNLKEISKK